AAIGSASVFDTEEWPNQAIREAAVNRIEFDLARSKIPIPGTSRQLEEYIFQKSINQMHYRSRLNKLLIAINGGLVVTPGTQPTSAAAPAAATSSTASAATPQRAGQQPGDVPVQPQQPMNLLYNPYAAVRQQQVPTAGAGQHQQQQQLQQLQSQRALAAAPQPPSQNHHQHQQPQQAVATAPQPSPQHQYQQMHQHQQQQQQQRQLQQLQQQQQQLQQQQKQQHQRPDGSFGAPPPYTSYVHNQYQQQPYYDNPQTGMRTYVVQPQHPQNTQMANWSVQPQMNMPGFRNTTGPQPSHVMAPSEQHFRGPMHSSYSGLLAAQPHQQYPPASTMRGANSMLQQGAPVAAQLEAEVHRSASTASSLVVLPCRSTTSSFRALDRMNYDASYRL
ncbi:hypothetical protein PMAYCL1PPCAC_32303, partial [Pristionchus mayeri]